MTRVRRRFRAGCWVGGVVGIMILLLFVKAGLTAAAGWEALNAARAVQTAIGTPNTALEPALTRATDAARRAIDESRFWLPLTQLLGGNGCALRKIYAAADALLPVMDHLQGAAADLTHAAQAGGAALPVARLRDGWSADAANTAAAALGEIAAQPACEGAQPMFSAVDAALASTLPIVQTVLQLDPSIALRDGARWLVLLNNSDELRAGGGFTTAYVEINVADGLLMWGFFNSYNADALDYLRYYPAPPAPMRAVMGIPLWVFRDANWSPDHPTAAAQASLIYDINPANPRPDGIIAVNFTALNTLMRYLPPLIVDDEPFDAATAVDRVREAWNEDAPLLNSYMPDRKNFLMDLMTAVLVAASQQVTPEQWLAALPALPELFSRRDIMIYAADPTLAAPLAAAGWDGSLIHSTGDYLLVVDTNLGYNKVTPRVERDLRYTVNLVDLTATLALDYTNTNQAAVSCAIWHQGWIKGVETLDPIPTYQDRMTGCYWNYLRVFLPLGARITSSNPQPYPPEWFAFTEQLYPARLDAWSEGGYEGYGMLLIVPTGRTSSAQFNYRLPETVLSAADGVTAYRLLIQRQAGALDHRVRVQITLPLGTSLVSASPNPQVEGGRLTFDALLNRDVTIDVRYR